MTNYHIITLFPESFESYLKTSILKRAIEDKKIKVSFYNPRNFTPRQARGRLTKKDTRIDRKPYGGGPGMVIQAEPVIKAIQKALRQAQGRQKTKKTKIIFLSPSGKQFDTAYAKKTAKSYKDVVASGPRYKSMKKDDGKIIIKFDCIGSGLKCKDSGALKTFAIAGEDKKWVIHRTTITDIKSVNYMKEVLK